TDYVFLREVSTVRVLNSRRIGSRWRGPFRRMHASFYGEYTTVNEGVRLVGSIGWRFDQWIQIMFLIFMFSARFFASLYEGDTSIPEIATFFSVFILIFLVQFFLTTKEISKLRMLLENLDPITRPHSN
ncbi:MAG: hypothetical protein RIF46_11310, partial [Cyclobacteriaceae bacterium]